MLDGQIDDTVQLKALADEIHDKVVIDLARVSFINSVGVREWVRLLKALHERGVKVIARRCSEALVFQFNMIPQTLEGIAVESFFAPYACASCSAERSICIEVAPHLASLRRAVPPPMACPTCARPMEFDEIAERFLRFTTKLA